MKEEEKRLKEEKDVSKCGNGFVDAKSRSCNIVCSRFKTELFTESFCFQRVKAGKAEITRFLQKSKIQQAPKVSRYNRMYVFVNVLLDKTQVLSEAESALSYQV